MIIGPFQTLNTGSLCPYPCRPGAMYPFECVACHDYKYYTSTCTVHVLVHKKTHEFQEKVYGTNASMYLWTELGTKSLFCYSLLLLLALDSMCNNVRSNDLDLYIYFQSNSLHILLVTVINGNE
jgi:hypothetical protein